MRHWLPGVLVLAVSTAVLAGPIGSGTLPAEPRPEYAVAIEKLATAKLLVGYPDLSIRPHHPATRYEWAAMVSRLVWHFDLDLPGRLKKPADVPWNHWAEDACRVTTAARLYPAPDEAHFRGDDYVTRGEFALMAWNLVQAVQGVQPPARLADTRRPFETSARALEEMGILQGYPGGKLGLEDPMSRGQICIAAARIVDWSQQAGIAGR